MEETLEHRTILVVERSGATHVIDIPMGALAPRASIIVHWHDRTGDERLSSLEVYYAGAGVYYEQGDPCHVDQP